MSSSTKIFNTVLIGLGMVADTHLKAIAGLNGKVRLKGVYARTAQTAQQYAAKATAICGESCTAYASIQQITDDQELDFVIIATPPNARLALVKLFTQAKLPILMEKPIERTSGAALEIVTLCEASNTLLGMVFQHRARVASIKLQQMIKAGELGQLGMVNVAAPLWRAQSYYDEPGRGSYQRDGGGVLISQAIHTLDLMLSLTGEVTEVQAMSRTSMFHQMESEDFVSAGMTFKNGAIGSLLATTANYPGGSECITLHFTKAVAKLERSILEIFWRDGRTESYGESEAIIASNDPMAYKASWHGSVITDFIEAIAEQRLPMATGREGLKVHRLIDALMASSELQKTVAVSGEA
ncbi:MAG: Gfo/Idh/MocA family oxidoreductase [Oceanospirillaceae bacterium]|nr:Gfo/Idh/MocA family oxidoreductase [Oceanospirillaceae bacterium]